MIEIDSRNVKRAEIALNQMVREVLSDKKEPVAGQSRFVSEGSFSKHCIAFMSPKLRELYLVHFGSIFFSYWSHNFSRR